MFKRNEEAPSAPQFPDMATYEVLCADGSWEKVQGHNCSVQDGCLLIHRGVFVNEDCTQPGVVPAEFFAQGEWRRAKTDFQGFQRRSELAIN